MNVVNRQYEDFIWLVARQGLHLRRRVVPGVTQRRYGIETAARGQTRCFTACGMDHVDDI
jgi:hypothetical protein